MSSTIEIKGLQERQKQFDKMLSTDPDMRKRLQGVIRKILAEVRKKVSADAQAGLQMQSDPRKAYKAVRSAVYKRIIGGQVNILNKRKAGSPGNYKPTHSSRSGKRGGNRWGRSRRTDQVDGYQGSDRGFILRFLNAGAGPRAINSYTTKTGSKSDLKTRERGGNRGTISGRNWFSSKSQKEMETAADELQNLIDRVINEEFK